MAGTSGENGEGGGLFIQLAHLTKTCMFTRVWITGCTFSSNRIGEPGHGGNIAIIDYINALASTISVENSIIHNGKATSGGGISYNSRQLSLECACTSDMKNQQPVYIHSTQFIGNIALGTSGDIMFIVDTQGADKKTLSEISTKIIKLQSSTFLGSSCLNPYPGSCTTIRVQGTFNPEGGCINEFIFQNSTFTNASGAMALSQVCKALFSDVQFTGIKFSALCAISSIMVFKGNNLFEGNYGINGGAMLLLGDNRILLEPNSSIIFRGNRAFHVGGAIYVNVNDFRSHFTSTIACLFQPYMPSYEFTYSNPNISIYMEGNTANFAGTSLYGGHVDQCRGYIKYPDFNSSLGNTPSQLFDSIFHFLSPNDSDYSVIASDPTGVCACIDDKPYCDGRILRGSTLPGALLAIPAIAVGQRNGTVRDGVVFAVHDTGSPYTATQETFCADKTLGSDTLCQYVSFRLFLPNGTTHV